MRVAFVSNYMVIHQKPFCDALVGLLGAENFKFVACEELEAYRKTTGYRDMNDDSCVIRAYESEDAKRRAREFVLAADAAIVTINYPEWLELRRGREGGVTFVYIERLLKIGLWYRFFPYPKYKQAWDNCLKWRGDARYHMLCASAFGSSDLSLFKPGFPAERCWKWGYFPPTGDVLESGASKKRASIVWVARLIQLKRPYRALQLAERLRADGYEFKLTMVGDGPMKEKLARYVRNRGLEGCVELLGVQPNERVRGLMRESEMMLFTSTRREGWGAVLNECMAEGCTPVAASMIGSVPYLVEQGVNGCVFDDASVDSMVEQVERLLGDPALCERMGEAARKTVKKKWNAEEAARRFVSLSEVLLGGASESPFADGPCSRAGIVRDDWFRNIEEVKGA